MTAGRVVAVLAVLITCAAPVTAGSQDLRMTPPEIALLAKGGAGAGTSGVVGIQTTTLYGDPTKAGLYVIEIRVPANTRIAAHTHQDDRTAVVVSGSWWFGYGAALDDGAAKALTAGSFYTEPAGRPHFALTRAEPAVVYVTGVEPTDTRFTDPARATGNTATRP